MWSVVLVSLPFAVLKQYELQSYAFFLGKCNFLEVFFFWGVLWIYLEFI